MTKAKAVIGANFGDEGKGLITDFFSHPHGEEALVVRYNGGAQAGHTVTTPDGKRHIFSHFGCGSFNNSPTFLSRFFVCNPLLFVKELAILDKKISTLKLYADETASVTTPFDIMINQMTEELRGNKRHGSCGMGFGETIERSLHTDFQLTTRDLHSTATIKNKLDIIRRTWVPKRLEKLGITAIPDVWQSRISSDSITQKFIDDNDIFLKYVEVVKSDFIKTCNKNIIFEGAQGLLLDQDMGWFPHVTRSNTGIKNIITLAEENSIDEIDATYITRAYTTRHGAGPLPHEVEKLPYPDIKDETNVTNTYQGSLRFAFLDADLLKATIDKDLQHAKTSQIKVSKHLAITCLDQIGGEAHIVKDCVKITVAKQDFAETMKKHLTPQSLFLSHGPTRATITAQG